MITFKLLLPGGNSGNQDYILSKSKLETISTRSFHKDGNSRLSLIEEKVALNVQRVEHKKK